MINIKRMLYNILLKSEKNYNIIKQEARNKKIFYVHVAKTGGTSINHIISSYYKNSEVENHIERYVHKKDYKKIEQLKEKQFISGHIKYKLARNIFGNNYFYIASFRDPIEHLISHLCWVKRLSLPEEINRFKKHGKNIQELALKLKMVDFGNIEQLNSFLLNLNKTGRSLFDNCQTRYFENTIAEDRMVNRKDYISAAENIKKLDQIIILEDFQNGINTLTNRMGWNNKNIETKKNKSKDYFGLDKDNKDMLKLIRKFNKYDVMLYKKVKNIYKIK